MLVRAHKTEMTPGTAGPIRSFSLLSRPSGSLRGVRPGCHACAYSLPSGRQASAGTRPKRPHNSLLALAVRCWA